MYSLISSHSVVSSAMGGHWISRSASRGLRVSKAWAKVCVTWVNDTRLPCWHDLGERLVSNVCVGTEASKSHAGEAVVLNRQCRTRSRRGQLWSSSTRTAVPPSRLPTYTIHHLQLDLIMPSWCCSAVHELSMAGSGVSSTSWPPSTSLLVAGAE
jgi:hypothetical protein